MGLRRNSAGGLGRSSRCPPPPREEAVSVESSTGYEPPTIPDRSALPAAPLAPGCRRPEEEKKGGQEEGEPGAADALAGPAAASAAGPFCSAARGRHRQPPALGVQDAAARSTLDSVAGKAEPTQPSGSPSAGSWSRKSTARPNLGSARPRSCRPPIPRPRYARGDLLRQRNSERPTPPSAKPTRWADENYYLGVALQRLRRFDEAVAHSSGRRPRRPDPLPDRRHPPLPGAVAARHGQSQPGDRHGPRPCLRLLLPRPRRREVGRKDLLVNDMERFLALAPGSPEADRAKMILRAVKK